MASQSEEMLFRAGLWDSARRLAAKCARAEQEMGIHGVSAHAHNRGYDIVGVPRTQVAAVFEVRDTPDNPLGYDPAHRTIVLPKPVTEEVAEAFNRALGRTKPLR